MGAVRGSENLTFDLCILDEASKATATETIVPLVSSERWVLVGDNKQLPPFIEHALQDPKFLESKNLTANDVRQNLFDLLDGSLPIHSRIILSHQHRMHPAIGRLISDCFYEGSLTSEARGLPKHVEIALGSAVLWADTSRRRDRRESKAGHSFVNSGEARVINKILDRLSFALSSGEERVSVAVLTGYEAQRKELQKTLQADAHRRPHLDVQIANVDSFQGQEADIAIFSVVRSNESSDIGFLKSSERLNVALSRARDGLVIVGDADFASRLGSTRSDLPAVWKHVGRYTEECSVEGFEDNE